MLHDSAKLEQFKRQVAQEWQDPRVTAAYRTWSDEEAEWGSAARDYLIAQARLAPGLNVLDVGSAHGEPGLAIAEAIGPHGHVTLIDIAPDLLAIAEERAARRGLANVTTRVADAHALPFADGAFDRLTSRLAAMYFVDPAQAFGEALRVLKPGGLAVYLVWGAPDQPMFRDILGVLFRYGALPEEEPGAPSPFRYSEPGALRQALEQAGFVNLREERVTLPTRFPGSPEQWWQWMHDSAAPVQIWFASLSTDDQQRALGETVAALRPYHNGESVNIPIDAIVVAGSKPA